MKEYPILNRQRRVRVPMGSLEKFLGRARGALRLGSGAFTICLVTDSEIARWNRTYRGKKGPTDVLSFPADGNPRKHDSLSHPQTRRGILRLRVPSGNRKGTISGREKPPGHSAQNDQFAISKPKHRGNAFYLGDIAIAPAVALRNSRRWGRTFDEEMRILMLHGMLHLMGYDHETDTGQMERREQRLRRTLGLD